MKLIHAEIKNFRSIKSEVVHFDIPCRVLVGINESGKTSILHALSLLDPNKKISNDDIRLASSEEDDPKVSEVNFVFHLETEEIAQAEAGFRKKFLLSSADGVLFQDGSKTLTITQFCNTHSKVLYYVDLMDDGLLGGIRIMDFQTLINLIKKYTEFLRNVPKTMFFPTTWQSKCENFSLSKRHILAPRYLKSTSRLQR